MRTVYIAGVYEQTGTSTNRYYPEAGAMRRRSYPTGNGVFYLLKDQLKSTSVIASKAFINRLNAQPLQTIKRLWPKFELDPEFEELLVSK